MAGINCFPLTTQPQHHWLFLPYTLAETKHTAEVHPPVNSPFNSVPPRLDSSLSLRLKGRHLAILARYSDIYSYSDSPHIKTPMCLKPM